ncbi:hypothetical protein Taro_055667, partial [Colocasia esculenta]|nr:hypothetical protein [Colocasia esculenta]
NLLQSPGSRRALRELPRELHHAATFPRVIQRCRVFYNRPTTPRYLLEASETPGCEAGARGEESELRELPSGEPITCTILRLASTPMPPTATATLCVHIHCRQVQAINVHISGRQQVSDHLLAANSNRTAAGPVSFQDQPCSLPAQTTHSNQALHSTDSHWPHNGRHNHKTHDPHGSEKHATLHLIPKSLRKWEKTASLTSKHYN